MNIGLYDSDTGENLKVLKTVDVTKHQSYSKKAVLVFTEAKRGRIVQLQNGIFIHYFLDETRGRKMMLEDSEHFGFLPRKLLTLADRHAPKRIKTK